MKAAKNRDVCPAVQGCRFLAMKSDIIRLALIFEFGGIYNDLKNKPMKTFLHEIESSDQPVITEHPPTVPNYAGYICNAFIAASCNGDVIKDCLSLACTNVLQRTEKTVRMATGIGVLQRIMSRAKFYGRSSFTVVPSEQAWGTQSGEGGWMRRIRAAYNGPDNSAHWSVRQVVEGIYADPQPSDHGEQ